MTGLEGSGRPAVPSQAVRTAQRGGEQALVTVGGRTFAARVLGERVTRRGHQTLVSIHGQRSWVASQRVERMGKAA